MVLARSCSLVPLPILRLPPHEDLRTSRGVSWLVMPSTRGTFTPYLPPVLLAYCNTRFRLVGWTFAGQELILLDRGEWFQLCHNIHSRTCLAQ